MRHPGGAADSLRLRLPLLVLGLAALLGALWAGLERLPMPAPLTLPVPRADWPLLHGPLMISGFLGTVIGLERAVGLRRTWAFTGPLFTGLAGLVLIAGLPPGTSVLWGAALATAGSVVLVAVFVVVVYRQPTLHTVSMGAGAACWAVGNALWLGGLPIPLAVPWWMAFLVFTIVGERLELNRLQPPSSVGRALFLGGVLLLEVGVLLHGSLPPLGWRVMGLALLGLAIWLLRYDIARRTVRQQGLTRYMAVCLLGGYAWLAVCGLSLLVLPPQVAGPAYDASLHALFLGFVFVMIFAHAPVIFPAVLRRPMAYTPRFYSHLALLHAGLLLRVVGDWSVYWPARQWGGVLAALAIALFLVNTALALRAGSRAPAKSG